MNETVKTIGIEPANPRDKLVADLKLVISDAEELLRATAGQAGDKATELRHRIQDRLDAAKADLARVQAEALNKAKAASTAADNFVHDQPWTAVGIAAGVGLLVGLILGRR